MYINLNNIVFDIIKVNSIAMIKHVYLNLYNQRWLVSLIFSFVRSSTNTTDSMSLITYLCIKSLSKHVRLKITDCFLFQIFK